MQFVDLVHIQVVYNEGMTCLQHCRSVSINISECTSKINIQVVFPLFLSCVMMRNDAVAIMRDDDV